MIFLQYVPLVSLLILGIVWAVRLEGKINVQQQVLTDLKELISTRLDRIEHYFNGKLLNDKFR